MRRGSFWLVVLVTLLASFSVQAASDDLTMGLAAYKAKQWKDAAFYLHQALENYPNEQKILLLAFRAHMHRAKELLRAKKYEEVVEVCTQALQYELPEEYPHAWVPHYNLGMAYKAQKRLDESREALERALSFDEKNKTVAFALGNVYYFGDDFEKAIKMYELLAAKESGNAVLYANLSQAYYKYGDMDKAISHMQRALEISPGSAMFLGLMKKMKREHGVEADYDEARTSHFSISFKNTKEQREAREQLSGMLESAYAKITDELGTLSGANIQAVVYPTGKDYGKALAAPTWTAALYDGKLRLPLETLDNQEALEKMLRHEITHHAIHGLTKGNCPTWLHEGLAQYMEGEEKPGNRSRIRSITRDLKNVMAGKGSRGYSIPLPALERSWMRGMNGHQVRTAYAQSYYLMKYIVDKHGMYRVRGMLEDLGKARGESHEDIMKRNLGTNYKQLTKDWTIWLSDPSNLE